MATSVKRHASNLLLGNKKRSQSVVMFACLAAFVVFGVVALLRQRGIAANTTQQVLDCQVQGVVAHTHDESCYDADGDLVCPLPERGLHVHDDSCYAEERTLVCGLEESEGHAHSDACYDAEGNLICGMEESEGHVHDDACYEVERVLVCGEEEVAEEHVHGPACFRETETSESEMPAQTFSHLFKDTDEKVVLGVDVAAPEGALPAGTTMKVEWVEEGQIDRELVQAALDDQAGREGNPAGKLLDLQAFTITFADETGAEVKPASDVTVTLTSALVNNDEAHAVVGVETDAEARAKAELEGKEEYEIAAGAVNALDEAALEERELTLSEDQLAFEDKDFTQYVLTASSREMKMTSEGETVRVIVEAPAEAGIPQDSTIQVMEIAPDTQEYETYEASALDAMSAKGAELARFFDIKILDPKGEETQPQAPVSVKIKLEDAPTEGEQPAVVHFDESAGEPAPELIPAEANNLTTKFEAESFSVYGVVYTVDFHWQVDGKEYSLSINGGDTISLKEILTALHVVEDKDVQEFVTQIDTVTFSNPELIVVEKLEDNITAGELKKKLDLAPEYSAELDEEQLAEMDAKELVAPDWALVTLQAFDTEESLTLTMSDGEVFTIKVTDARDPLGLDGRTFAIVNQRSGGTGAGNWFALKAEVGDAQGRGYYLNADQVSHSTSNGSEYCDASATAWKFEYDSDHDAYYVSCGGQYLYIDPTVTNKEQTTSTNNKAHALNLVTDKNQADNGTLIKITKDENGNFFFRGFNDDSLYLWDYGGGKYWLDNEANTANGAMRLCLPEASGNNDPHKASLISVADSQPGQKLVVYQRVWVTGTDGQPQANYYAIDGYGNLVQVSNSSDAVYWRGNKSIEWTMTDLGNGYYTLYNEETDTYLTPKSNGIVHSADDVAFNGDPKHLSLSLPGRESGAYTSRIASWDYNANVTYGMTATTSSITPVEFLDSQYFYFAARDPIVTDQLTTVDTVDSKSNGIKITMYDWGDTRGADAHRQFWDQNQNGNTQAIPLQDRLPMMQNIMGSSSDNYVVGAATTNILKRYIGEGEDSPEILTNAGHHLNELFADEYIKGGSGNKEQFNNLFLQSVYDETGFYKYSCFENYAYLPEGSTDFTVYEQIGTPSNRVNDAWNSTNDNFGRGQFMPYNPIGESMEYRLNLRDPDLGTIDPSDPRYAERVYYIQNEQAPSGTYNVTSVPDYIGNNYNSTMSNSNNPETYANYFFGMKMEAKFTQNAGGIAENGDPMVYEFNGDDDLWIYIDNVLVLDLGGIHDAFRGKINFQTGKVTSNASNGQDTTIKEMFRLAGKFPDGTDWDPTRVDEYFKGDTFRDDSTHEFVMYYMERGASASNLDMQFNLSVLSESQFRVKKEMPETQSGQAIQGEYADAAFYYEAYIKDGEQFIKVTRQLLEDRGLGMPTYENEDGKPVVWKSDSPTETIFEVKPGHTAVFPAGDDNLEWYVVEVEPEAGSHMLDNYEVSNSDEDPSVPDGTKSKVRTIKNRNIVTYQNKPDDKLVNDLQIKKKVHGTPYNEDDAFEYRVFLENTEGELVPYSFGEYYQIDKDGKYVYYENGVRKLAVDNGDGTYTYTYSDKPAETVNAPKISEHTSTNGSIGDIRDGDTIIIKGLLEGTDFYVYERTDYDYMCQDATAVDGKYVFVGTEVSDAYIRETQENKPEYPVGTLYDQPGTSAIDGYASDYEKSKAARGTIIQEKTAKVDVLNQPGQPLEMTLEKVWDGIDGDDSALENSEVVVTLGRYILEDKAGTLNITKSGVPEGAALEATYTVEKNVEGNYEQVGVYTYNRSSWNREGLVASLSLAPGEYRVTETIVSDDASYSANHPDAGASHAQTVTIVDDGTETAPFTSTYTEKTGVLRIVSNFTDTSGKNIDFSGVTYTVHDSSNNVVGTYSYNDVAGGLNIPNLKIGHYTVQESGVPAAPTGAKLTHEPELSGGISTQRVTVEESHTTSDPATVTFTSTYEEQSNPVRVSVLSYQKGNHEYNHSDTITKEIVGYEYVKITFSTPDWNVNNPILFESPLGTNMGASITWHDGVSSGKVTGHVILSIPENTEDWYIYVRDNNSPSNITDVVIEGYAGSRGKASAKAKSAKKAPKLAATPAGTDEQHVTNTGNGPTLPADNPKKYVEDTAFNAENHIYTLTQADGWTKIVDDLPAVDAHGNLYEYYILRVDETGLPEGTTATIELGGAQGTDKILVNSENAGTQHLVVNNSVGKPADIELMKKDASTDAYIGGATFYLLSGTDRMSGELAPTVTSLGAGTPAITVDAEGVFEVPQVGVKIAGLKPGTYTLVEKTPPDGYVMETSQWSFEVTKAGQLTGDSSIINGLVITIPNTPGRELPNSGGPGTLATTLAGLTLVGVAGAYLLRKRLTESQS